MQNLMWTKLLFVELSMLLTGCCTKNKCDPEVLLVVHDESGGLLTQADGLTIGGSASASPCPNTMNCSFYLYGSDYDVGAPGFKPAAVHVTPATDDCGNSVAQTLEVKLVLESAAETSVVQRTLGHSCGD